MEKVVQYEFRSLVPRLRKLFSFEEEGPTEEIDPVLLREASIALWVLYSENTNPSYEAILERTRKKTLKEAYETIIAELKKKNLLDLFEKVEQPLIPIITAMQEWGIMIDRPYFETLRDAMKEKLVRIEKEVIKLTGESINLNSPKQLSGLLFGTLGLKPKGKQKASGAYTTNADTLEALVDDHPVIPQILEHREVQKLLSTYVEALLLCADERDIVHSTFLQHGAATGRFSSTNPNLQNIPIKSEGGTEVRHGFMARSGHVFVGCDYSQIELRVLAMLSGDARLIETFQKGEDIHARVASGMFGVPTGEVTSDMRRKAKVINFGILYGMGVSALQKNLKSTKTEAMEYYATYFETFPTIAAYIEGTKNFAKEHGYTETMFGRRRYFPGITSAAPFLRAFAERMAVNAPIQGTNADIIKIAIALIDADLRAVGLHEKAHLTLQIHDELVYEVEAPHQEQVSAIIQTAMNGVFERSPIEVAPKTVPLAVSTGSGYRLDELK
jgi:DNA polymerase-1